MNNGVFLATIAQCVRGGHIHVEHSERELDPEYLQGWNGCLRSPKVDIDVIFLITAGMTSQCSREKRRPFFIDRDKVLHRLVVVHLLVVRFIFSSSKGRCFNYHAGRNELQQKSKDYGDVVMKEAPRNPRVSALKTPLLRALLVNHIFLLIPLNIRSILCAYTSFRSMLLRSWKGSLFLVSRQFREMTK